MRAQQPLALILSRWRHTTHFVRLTQHHLSGSGCWGFLLCFWKPGQGPSEKELSCHSLIVGLVSMCLTQQIRGATAMCSGKA